MNVSKFPTTNPKLLVMEELAKVAEDPSTDLELSERITSYLTVERYEAVGDPNSMFHRAMWNTVLRFVAWNQHKLPVATMARIRGHISKIRKPNVQESI
jgi:hypothetical protein